MSTAPTVVVVPSGPSPSSEPTGASVPSTPADVVGPVAAVAADLGMELGQLRALLQDGLASLQASVATVGERVGKVETNQAEIALLIQDAAEVLAEVEEEVIETPAGETEARVEAERVTVEEQTPPEPVKTTRESNPTRLRRFLLGR